MRVVPREIVMIQSRPGMQLCIPRAGLFFVFGMYLNHSV